MSNDQAPPSLPSLARHLGLDPEAHPEAWETLPGMTGLVIEPSSVSPVSSAESDALSALISLGYKPQEASRAVAAVKEDGLSSEEMIRRALKGML